MLLTAQRASQTFQRFLRSPVDSAELLLFALGVQRAAYFLFGLQSFEGTVQFRIAAKVLPSYGWGVLLLIPPMLAIVALRTGLIWFRVAWNFTGALTWLWLGLATLFSLPTSGLGLSFVLYALAAAWIFWRVATDHARELRPIIGMDGAGDGRE